MGRISHWIKHTKSLLTPPSNTSLNQNPPDWRDCTDKLSIVSLLESKAFLSNWKWWKWLSSSKYSTSLTGYCMGDLWQRVQGNLLRCSQLWSCASNALLTRGAPPCPHPAEGGLQVLGGEKIFHNLPLSVNPLPIPVLYMITRKGSHL